MSVKELFTEYQRALCGRIDRAFAWLITIQWILTMIIVKIQPQDRQDSWNRNFQELGSNSWLILFLGAFISVPSLYCSFFKPGEKISRYIISIAQMGFSWLFIHLMSSHPEAHFHVFISLAFIAAYRDWRILAVAGGIIIGDYLLHAFYYPSEMTAEIQWQWLEYIGWMVFEIILLSFVSIQTKKEMYQIAKSKLEIMKAREYAENLNIRRTQFFSVISHELRTPLNGIIGFSDFLREAAIPEEQREYVNIIKQCSHTLLKLINDLLDFSKIDSGCLEIDSHLFKVHDIRSYFENVFLLECKKKNIDFFFQVAEDVPCELFGDSYRIRQVLSNLISNAIKFTESGSIQVRISKQQNEKDVYRWDVVDTGIGIKKDYLPKIFSPYTQEYSATARKYGGSGLGLSISKKLVELMGGQISVESTLRKGTVFFFTIPLMQSKPNNLI